MLEHIYIKEFVHEDLGHTQLTYVDDLMLTFFFHILEFLVMKSKSY